jgi:hypothetical protein
MAAFHAKMTLQRVRRDAGGTKELAHLHQNRLHVRLEYLPPPGMPPAPPGDTDGNDSYEFEDMASSRVYIHSPYPNTQFLNPSAFGKDSKCNSDLIPDALSALCAAWKYC